MNFLQSLRVFSGRSIITRKYFRAFSTESDQQNASTNQQNRTTDQQNLTTDQENTINQQNIVTEDKLGGYAKSFQKFEQSQSQEPETPMTFASLLRNSKLIDVSTTQSILPLLQLLWNCYSWEILKEKLFKVKYFTLLKMIYT